jgi:hypothetical protein
MPEKEADFIKHLRTESRESRASERERKGKERSREREKERAGERKDGWEIERVGGLGGIGSQIGTMGKSVKVERFKGFFFRCHALQQMENTVVFCMENLQ